MKNMNSMREMQARRQRNRPEPILILKTPEELCQVFDLAKLGAPWQDIVDLIIAGRERIGFGEDS